MCSFWNWLISPDNINTNVFTFLTAILSGIISLAISAAFFHKGNRDNLKASIISPMKCILDKHYSWENYKELEKLKEEYSSSYLYEKEKQIIAKLLSAYKDICPYTYERVCAGSVSAYFEYKIQQKGIEIKNSPVIIL